MKKVFFIIWCILDIPAFYLLFLSFKELINQVCVRSVLDCVYCLFVIVLVLNVQIRAIIHYFKKS